MIVIALVIAIITVLLVSALCSLVEAALFSVPINRVQTWVEDDHRFSRSLLKIKESMDKPIASIVILNNISNIAGSLVIGGLIADLFHRSWVGWVGISSGLFTFLIIVFSEIIPKGIGENYCDQVALISAKPVNVLTKMFTPILYVLSWITNPFNRGEKRYPKVSEEEIKMMARLGTSTGVLEKEEETIIRNALMLHDIPVKAIMTPRIKIFAFNEKLTIKEVREDLLNCPFSRVPLFKEKMDDVTGLLYKIDVFASICSHGDEDMPLSQLKKEIIFVPENKPIDKLMEELRITQSHTAIVIDQYGGTAGLVTLEDVLEEIVGDIAGEEDAHDEKYIIISENEILAPGVTLVEEVNEYFKSNIEENHQNISKLILESLNRFPKHNEHIELGDLCFIVEKVTEKTIEKVRIKRDQLHEENTN